MAGLLESSADRFIFQFCNCEPAIFDPTSHLTTSFLGQMGRWAADVMIVASGRQEWAQVWNQGRNRSHTCLRLGICRPWLVAVGPLTPLQQVKRRLLANVWRLGAPIEHVVFFVSFQQPPLLIAPLPPAFPQNFVRLFSDGVAITSNTGDFAQRRLGSTRDKLTS